jgi:putative lipoprotein
VYACPDGFRFSVRPREDSVLVSLPERAVALPAAPAASGARYSAGGITFWSKGPEGSLEQEGTVRTGCPGRSAGDPWEEALLLGIDFRGVGQEPGWVLDLDDGRWIRYVGDYGATTVFAAAPDPERAPEGGAVYRARGGDGRELVVAIRQTPCRDVMSGQSFTHAVSVRLDGGQVDGCGRALLCLREAGMTAAGSTGCNGFSGQFERDGDRIRFGRMAATLMACADPALMAQERRFLQVLERVDRAAVVGDDMTLYAGDQPLARFVAVYFR